jgi:hypothetical protein
MIGELCIQNAHLLAHNDTMTPAKTILFVVKLAPDNEKKKIIPLSL